MTATDNRPSAGDGLADPADPAAVPWRRAVRDVLVVAVLVVAGVLGAAILTSALPEIVQRVVFHTPLAIVFLIAVSALVLWRITGRQPPPD